MNFRKQLRAETVGFQLAPMIDIVFLMLFFFVSSQLYAQWETEIGITLPTAQTGETPQRLPGEVIINILPDGATVVNARVLDEVELRSMMDRLVKHFPGQPILIRADKSTPYEHIIRILDQCRQADIWNISFATGVPE